MNTNNTFKYLRNSILVAGISAVAFFAHANSTITIFRKPISPPQPMADTAKKDTLKYPIYDRRSDIFSNPKNNPFDLKDNNFSKQTIEYDPITKEYYVMEKIGTSNFRTPISIPMKNFMEMQGKIDEADYFKKRFSMLSDMNRLNFKPQFTKSSKDWFNRIIGNGKIEIKPTGYVDLMAGYTGQKTNNPTLPERARNNGGPDFDMNTQFNLDANIGDKIKLPINYNTQAFSQLENKLNFNYEGKPDEILKQFQLGNTNFNTKSTLIPKAQSLFGVKTQLQFGKLMFTGVMANQRAERQTASLQNGKGTDKFEIKANDYEENRHFLLAQYFRNNYNKAMSRLPLVNSQARIMRMEVWVTNRTGVTTETRDVVGLMDIGEGDPYRGPAGNPNTLPNNNANQLYRQIASNPSARSSSSTQSTLSAMGLSAVQDYEKTFARKLTTSEYFYNPQIGFLSLNVPLYADEVLAVAYQYTYNGKVHQVGEFSQDVPPDSTANSQNVLFLKLLKATSQRTALPLWDLMMKNVYSVGFGQLDSSDFKVDLVYEEPSLGAKRYLPPTDVKAAYQGQPLLTLLNLDRLNNQKDPQPDGIYDFINGFTVIPSMSRLIFPVLEPFGHDLDYVFETQQQREKYLFYPLYDTIKAIAKTYANLDRFELRGRSKSFNSNQGDYNLGFNIPPGSVTVTANGQYLKEGLDYEVDYDQGTLRVTNQAILNSGVPVNINYENQSINSTLQQRNYLGLRLDYLANKNLSLGATMVRLGERPFFVKTLYGDDPIRNAMYGIDLDYNNEWPRLTKWLDKLPNYSTTATSTIKAFAEAAYLDPGHPKQIGKGSAGLSYVDDFESTRQNIDLRFPLISWNLSSIPQNDLFPEAILNNDLSTGYRRGKLAFYNIEPVLQERNNNNNPLKGHVANIDVELSKPQTRQVRNSEIFPQRSTDFGQGLLTTFDIAFYPKDKGPYNLENRAGKIDLQGRLTNPKSSWGGITRSLAQTDFETNNIEFIEFWMQDPFIGNDLSKGGKLYLNLGNISEDVLKDGKRQFENGLPTPNFKAKTDESTVWGKVPSNPMQVTNGFNIDPDDRKYQDVGFDGLTNDEEKSKFSDYLNNLLVTAPLVYQQVLNDPSGDDFYTYRDEKYNRERSGILQRYKNINNPSGNSPVATGNQFVTAFTQYPDAEELNRDNTLTEAEEYFEYELDIKPFMNAGSNFITDVREVPISLPNAPSRNEKWYLFRIPINSYTRKIGKIPDFKSIRFMRMYVSGFADSVVMRFGKIEMVRNDWRKFQYHIDTLGQYAKLPTQDYVDVNQLAVNIEENDQRTPIRYLTPPGIDRQQQLSNNNVQLYLNEQALSLKLCGLPIGESRGVFKNINLDMRQYGKLDMFIHAEGTGSDLSIYDRSLTAVVRIANDFQGNYYEVRIPLKKTAWGATDTTAIWPEENNLNLDLVTLTQLKQRRNKQGVAPNQYYKEVLPNGRTIAILGNPNLGEVSGLLLSVENTLQESVCAEVWFNELRFGRLDEKGGWAATARTDVNLADLGTLSGAFTAKSFGFGDLENRVNNRLREDLYNLDLSANLDAGKLLPKRWNLQVPVYAGISKIISNPEYDPYDQDIFLKDKITAAASRVERDSIKRISQDITTIKTLNFTNVKFGQRLDKKPQLWSPSNFEFSYSYINSVQRNPLLENEELTRIRGTVSYNYAPPKRTYEPFKRLIKSRSPWFQLIKDLNINYLPSNLSVKADVFRQMGASLPRNIYQDKFPILETFNKYFTFDRFYTLQWQLSNNLNIDYTASNYARIDEPFGRIDTKQNKDSVRRNLFKGGRNTHFMQNLTVNYKVPLEKIPFLDWTSVQVTYKTGYDWLAASLITKQLGNTLSNTQTRNITGELNFEALYNRFRFFKAVNTPAAPKQKVKTPEVKKEAPKKSQPDIKPKDNKVETEVNVKNKDKKFAYKSEKIADSVWAKMTKKERKKYKKEQRKKRKEAKRLARLQRKAKLPELTEGEKFVGGLLSALKSIRVQYNEDLGTTLPSYMDSTNLLGINLRSRQPGMPFIFGYQPDTSWINNFGQKGLLSADSLLTAQIEQRYNQSLRITAQISPIRDFNIDLNLDKTFSKAYSETYKDTTGRGISGLARFNPYALGSFEVSHISYKTMFEKFDPNLTSATFHRFENNRQTISKRLAKQNKYQGGGVDPKDPAYFKGYGRYAQDVIIPAFLAAYSRTSAEEIGLIKSSNSNLRSNPFAGIIPKPNWSLSYNGLSKIPAVAKVFSEFSLRHGYHARLGMNTFNTALLFQDINRLGMPSFIDTTTGNFIPYFLIPNITIQESFDPVIGIDMTFTNELSLKFEYAKMRTLTMSLIDYQLAEQNSTNITVGFNWRKKGLPFFKNLRIGKKGEKLDNDATISCNFTFTDNATSNSKLDQGTSFGTMGQRYIKYDPSISYILNKRVSLKMFFEQIISTPKISNAFPVTNTRAGVSVRVALDN